MKNEIDKFKEKKEQDSSSAEEKKGSPPDFAAGKPKRGNLGRMLDQTNNLKDSHIPDYSAEPEGNRRSEKLKSKAKINYQQIEDGIHSSEDLFSDNIEEGTSKKRKRLSIEKEHTIEQKVQEVFNNVPLEIKDSSLELAGGEEKAANLEKYAQDFSSKYNAVFSNLEESIPFLGQKEKLEIANSLDLARKNSQETWIKYINHIDQRGQREVINSFEKGIRELNKTLDHLNELEAKFFKDSLNTFLKLFDDVSTKYQELSQAVSAEQIQEKTGFYVNNHKLRLNNLRSIYYEYKKNKSQKGAKIKVFNSFNEEIRELGDNLKHLNDLETALPSHQEVPPGSTSDHITTQCSLERNLSSKEDETATLAKCISDFASNYNYTFEKYKKLYLYLNAEDKTKIDKEIESLYKNSNKIQQEHKREAINSFKKETEKLNKTLEHINKLEAVVLKDSLTKFLKLFDDVSVKYQDFRKRSITELIKAEEIFGYKEHDLRLDKVNEIYYEHKNKNYEVSINKVIDTFHNEIEVLEKILKRLNDLETELQRFQEVHPSNTSDITTKAALSREKPIV